MRYLDLQNPPPHEFNESLACFEELHLVEDLGYVAWYNNFSVVNRSRMCAGDVEVEEVRNGLLACAGWKMPEAHPRRLTDLDELRMTLPLKLPFASRGQGSKHKQRLGYFYKLPYAMPPVAAPFAASQRFDFSKIDFIVGGSVLYTLATGDFAEKDYTVQRWHDAVMVRRYSASPDFVDLKNKGLQIKRLFTGHGQNETGLHEKTVEHLQVLRIGRYNVLFIAEVDAVDKQGRRVEVKTVAIPNWRQIMFQMMAKGSTTFVHGIVSGSGPRMFLNEIDEYGLREIVQWCTTQAERARFMSNIIASLDLIHKRTFSSKDSIFRMDGTTFSRSARPGQMWEHTPNLEPLEGTERSLLPTPAVLKVLFPESSEDGESTESSCAIS